ncbi:hypothetical protein U0030_05330 [Brevundimonas bullata]|jgi:hypothetical protein|uniref:hypothetical protein n=2 Tax=Caulobacteraceae TaxID=76892 RepID=UPI000E0B20D2|nr:MULTISPECIES: hypothetical protein [Brevundimonas]WQE37896.1 hypothetical protein U0030_05330 [Brevundimonas bullata]
MSGQTELPRYSGAATIIRYAVYVHRGIIPAEDLHETFDGGSVLVTSSPERAIAEGLPPAAHRPPIGSILGGPPPPAWSADGAVERLRARLRSGAAVCIRLQRACSHAEMTLGWRDAVGLGFPIGATEAEVADLVSDETRVLTALSLSIPANHSPEFSLFDRTTLVRIPTDDRPVSVVTLTAPTASAWVAGREDTVDRDRFRTVITAEALSDLGLVHSAFDHMVSPLPGFLAAWAAIERIINGAFQASLARIEAGALGMIHPLIAKVLERRTAEDYRPSITDNFLLTCFGWGSDDLESDARAFKQVNRLRQGIYHRGDLADLHRARDEASTLLRRLLTLQMTTSTSSEDS